MMGPPAKMDLSLWRALAKIVEPQQRPWVLLIKTLKMFVMIMMVGMVNVQKVVSNQMEMGNFISIEDLVESSKEMTRFFA